MRVLLVNTNRMQPPIAPVGLDYCAAALQAAGHAVDLLDLCFATDPPAAIDRQLARAEYGLIGVTFRNTDDCYYPGRGWFVPELASVVRRLRQGSQAPLVLGGVGFSIMPREILRAVNADGGVMGEGEFALLRLANGDTAAPGVIWRADGQWRAAPPQPADLASLPPMRRDFVDNARYHREGGQLGFETKRGCAAHCLYCADPVAKGRTVRVRPPEAVAGELAGLAAQGLIHLHTCDAEFNRPLDHALAVCEAISRRELGERLRWYAYCAPTPFPDELARALRRAGCAGIDFGADSGDDEMLRRLGRDFSPEDVRLAVERCRRHGLLCMCDLLLGGPGETEPSVRRSLEFMRQISPERIGLSVGVRVYPGTPLAQLAAREPQALHGPGARSAEFFEPTFFLSPALGEGIFPLVSSIVGTDRRFFFSNPTAADRNYNYSGNDVLVDALRRGCRGAYWDILRRLQEGLPPE
ncbi:MAG: radical SAM protein [Verrucomicrobiota bacterium]